MIIQHNLSAMNANRMYGVIVENSKKSTEQLSSGYKVNRAADDAAGLSISEKMRRQIRGLNQAYNNLQDGVSLARVADGYLNEVHDMIQRTNELAVKAANGTLAPDDREYIDQEVQQLKQEMKRIFHTANFNEIPLFHPGSIPEIAMNPEPTDIQLFHAGNGGIGGLEFNNVRYNISELQQKGMKLTDDGIATEDQEVEFKLWDNETVRLKLKEGQSLADVKRNYEWSADDSGIYVNDVLAGTWEDMGVADRNNVSGNYSFDYHGTTISFEAESGSLDKLINKINGDANTKPANWDISVSGITARETAPVKGSTTIAVTAANKNDINDDYYLRANGQGLSIENRTDGKSTSVVAWNTFRDTNSPSADAVNGGYPVVDWGLTNDSNDSSRIKFDDSADYHFKSPDANIQIEFDFKLAEVASLDEVTEVLDDKPITGQILSPASLAISSASDGSAVTVSNLNITAGNTDLSFELQRDYGRAFAADNSKDTLSGKIEWKKQTLISEGDSGSGTLIGSPYSVSEGSLKTSVSNSDVVYVAREIGGQTLYFEASKIAHTDTCDLNFKRNVSWNESVKLTYTGSLGTVRTDAVDDTFSYSVSRTDSCAGTRTYDYVTYDVSAAAAGAGGKTLSELAAEKGVTESAIRSITISDAIYNQARSDSTRRFETSVTDDTTNNVTIKSKGTETASGTFSHTQDFKASGDSRTAFSFSQSITAQKLHDMTNGSASGSALSFRATGQAQRTFTPQADNTSLYESDFKKIKLNVPEKQLRIQSGPEAEDGIWMRWSPLNLTILGLSSTNTLTARSSQEAITEVKTALQVISETRSLFGAYQNRFEHAMLLTDNVAENTTAAESRIRDTDMAKEMTRFSNNNILAEAGQAMLAQANQTKQGILSLLG